MVILFFQMIVHGTYWKKGRFIYRILELFEITL